MSPINGRRTALSVILLTVILLGCARPEKGIRLESPGKNVVVFVQTDATGRTACVIRFDGRVVVRSPFGITVEGKTLGEKAEFGDPLYSAVDETLTTRGKHPSSRNHFTAMRIPVRDTGAGQSFFLEWRAYDNGAMVRTVVPGEGEREVTGESFAWAIDPGCDVWFHSSTANYEGIFKKAKAGEIEKGLKVAPPLTAKLPGDLGYLAITEGALFNYSGMTLESAGGGVFRTVFEDDPAGWTLADTIVTPWRIVMCAKDLDGLVNNDLVFFSAPPPKSELARADWIRPGRALWSWWSEGTGDWNLQKAYADDAKKMGFEFILIDEGWENWRSGSKNKWDLLKDVVRYAGERGVGVWVWKYWDQIDAPDERAPFFKAVKAAGVAGVKIDFMDSESKSRVDFYESALRDAADARLMINFHGANKPTGESRTWPNEVTREGIYGLEQNLSGSIPASHNAALPFTRFLAGPGDYTPCTFTREKLRGTTFAHQLATAIAFTSPLTHWADNPKNYLASPALDVLTAIPTVWDETRVLPGSRIGEVAAFARRKGGEWFVGIVNGDARKSFDVDLEFLGKARFQAVFLTDNPDHAPEFDRNEKVIESSGRIRVELAAGGGCVIRFSKTDLPAQSVLFAPPGGFLTGPRDVILTTRSPGDAIRYTLDGSRPGPESPLCSGKVTVDKPLTLNAATFQGGTPMGAYAEARFSTPPAPGLAPAGGLFIGKVAVAVRNPVPNGEMHYTLDGSEPVRISPRVRGSVAVTGDAVLKVKAFWKPGYESAAAEARYVRVEPREPDTPAETVPGAAYACFKGQWTSLPDFDAPVPALTGAQKGFSIASSPVRDYFGFRFTGFFDIPKDGVYTFFLNSDDGSRLWIGDTMLVNNDGLHSTAEKAGSIGLGKGKHAFKLDFFEASGGETLEVRIEGPGLPKQPVPERMLSHLKPRD